MSASPPAPDGARVRPLFTKAGTTLFRVALLAAALLVTSTGVGAYAYFHSNYWNRIGIPPPQPILFSHRHHTAELHIDCRNCHATVETSAYAGMPATHTCLACHSQIFATTTMIQPLIASAAQNQPVVWNPVNLIPAHVYFNHSIHIAKGVACVTCHGEIGRMALTAAGQSLTMRWCIDCHKNPGPRLSPPGDIFSPFIAAPRPALGRPDLMAYYHVQTASLTDCSTCHH